MAGISTHHVSTIEFCEKEDYDIDLYLFPLNLYGFVWPGFKNHNRLEDRIKIILETNKIFIIIKPLVAERIPPKERMPFVLKNIKDCNLIDIGFGAKEEVEDCVQIMAGSF